MIRQTGGLTLAATSTISKPFSWVIRKASSRGTTPIFWPFSSISWTGETLIWLLIRGRFWIVLI